MSKDSTGETGSELVRAERGRFAAGAPSANPHGRPKRGESIAEKYRRETDWTKVRERLEKIVTDPKSKDVDAVTAARELTDRAWGRPLASHELHVSSGQSEAEQDFSHLSIERRRELLAELTGGNPRLTEPQGTDDEAA